MLSGETVRNEKSGTSSLGQSGTKGIYPLRRSPRGGTQKWNSIYSVAEILGEMDILEHIYIET